MGRSIESMLAGLAALAILSASPTAHAAMRCSVTNRAGVAFGAYNALAVSALDSTGFIAIECSGVGAADALRIELGPGGSGTYFSRAMTGRNSRLRYNLFRDAARSIIWGDGAGGTSANVVQPPDGRSISIAVYGRIPPRQQVEADTYSDDVVVTILY